MNTELRAPRVAIKLLHKVKVNTQNHKMCLGDSPFPSITSNLACIINSLIAKKNSEKYLLDYFSAIIIIFLF